MRNIDRIRQMSLEELAPLLINDETTEFDELYFTSPSGNGFYDEEGAIEDCIKWLVSEQSRRLHP